MRVFITGTAGFIGFHVADLLLDQGWEVFGYDGMTNYYDVALKEARHNMLRKYENFRATEARLEDMTSLMSAMKYAKPDVVIHLAAQAGVRWSIEKPRDYVDTNIVGTFNVMEAAREVDTKHLLMASTSSVYGANKKMPYSELDKTDTQVSFYAATKKANEVMAHSWAHIHGIPTTMFRFFTVYGPWGRPDMALFKFTHNILKGKPIDIYNNGQMWRDFTYVSDLVKGIQLLLDKIPGAAVENVSCDSLSPVAPFRIVNIGNSTKVRLLDFVCAIEETIGIQAQRNYLPMQAGDVEATWADATLVEMLTGYAPKTDLHAGVQEFVSWFRNYYKI